MNLYGQKTDSPSDVESILKEAQVLYVALSDHGIPYVVPMCFGYEDQCIYLHSKAAGRKMEIMERHNVVCFCCVSHIQAVPADRPCSWSMHYRSVIGTGRARMVTDHEEKRSALECIARRFDADAAPFDDSAMAQTAVICIHIEQASCRIREPDDLSL